MDLKNFLRRFWRYVKRENFHRLFLAIGVLLLVSALAVTLMEPGLTFLDALWWSIVTLTTVGYGDISPATPGGRLVAVVLMVMGIGLLGTLSTTIF